MNKYFTIFLVLFSFNVSFSQIVSGKIVDENDMPLYGVSVYFDGTTLGTTTDNDGVFEMNLKAIPDAILVISFIGYETVYLNSVLSPIQLKLNPVSIALKGVVLEPIPFTRKEMLKIFREQFLGNTKSGRNCKILNEDAIQFIYESKDYKLSAFADQKLKVRNDYLGYIVEFELIDFYVYFSKRTVLSEYVLSCFYAGTTFYTDLTTNEKSYEKNRKSSYLGSYMHFFKNLTNNNWGKKDFILYDGSLPTDPNLFFEITDAKSTKKVTIKEKGASISIGEAVNFQKAFNLLYKGKYQSKVTFRTLEFTVDEFGNHSDIDKIDFSGEISKKRLGDMLPLNFVLPESEK
uniref:carboxypeptidase-like regulatory domain-containing protein n=1 Tax=Flavobacterium sp. TaxID=239 RepID=UPI00404B04FA